MTCDQCGKPFVYEVAGHRLCIDCTLKMQEIADRESARLAARYNLLLGQMEVVTGLTGVFPRAEAPIPRPQVGITLHNIKIDNSVVGAINTGTAQTIDVAMSQIKQHGSQALATELQKLTQAVIDSQDLNAAQKNEVLEHLAFLTTQAALPKDKRQAAVGKVVLPTLERLLNISASLITVWQVTKPLIEAIFK